MSETTSEFRVGDRVQSKVCGTFCKKLGGCQQNGPAFAAKVTGEPKTRPDTYPVKVPVEVTHCPEDPSRVGETAEIFDVRLAHLD